MFRDHILDYYYWFLYKAEDQYVQLRGNEFIADNVKVEYSVVSVNKAECIVSTLTMQSM